MFREGSTKVVVDGDFAVFFYDEANAEAAREGVEAIVGEDFDAGTAFRLTGAGILQAFEPWREGPPFEAAAVTVEVALAPPLTAAERKPWKWKRAPAKALLELPSGRLRIETEATLADPEAHPPAVLDVSPGSYAMKLERVDRERMKGEKLEAYEGPDAVVTLEPWPEKKKYEPGAPFIVWSDRSGRRPRWEGLWQVEGGAFRGQVIRAHMEGRRGRRMAVNMDRHAYDRLGLRRGMRLEVRADGGTWTVLCQGRVIPWTATRFLGEDGYEALAELHPMLLVGYQSNTRVPAAEQPTPILEYSDYDYFEIATISEDTEAYTEADDAFNRLFRLERRTPVEIRIVGEPFFERGPSPDDWTAADGELRLRVLSCVDTKLYLNGGLEAVRAIGFQDGDVLELEARGERRKVFDPRYLARHGGALGRDEGSEALRPAPQVEGTRRVKTRDRYHPDDLRHPPLYLEFGRDLDHLEQGMIELQSLLRFGGPMGLRGPFGPEEIHLELEEGEEVVVRNERLSRSGSARSHR